MTTEQIAAKNTEKTGRLERLLAPGISRLLVHGAIRSHHTETGEGAWDAGVNVKNLSNEDGKAVYRQMYAWVDAEADQDKKNAYKFPHHFVSADGTVGAASIKWNHLAAHLRDADLKPAELSSQEEMATENAQNTEDAGERLATYAATITDPCRRAEFEGRAYLVAPVVALVPGVLNGYLNPADEVAKYVDAWNDAPVPLGHPTRRGMNVSARSLDVLEHEVIGRFQNVTFTDNRLKGELWLEIEKAARLGEEAMAVLARLEAGEPVEVSTAYFADFEMTPGEWQGRAYEGIARNIRPDHLAVLPEAVGACSWKDGCGAPRVHGDLPQESTKNAEETMGGDNNAILSTGGDMRIITINVELTLDEQMERVVDALYSRQGPYPEPWGVRAIFSDRVIVETSAGLMEFPYTVTADTGAIEFGDPVEIEVIYQRLGEESGDTTTNALHTNKTGGCPCMEEHQETVVNEVPLEKEVTPVQASEPQAPSLPADLADFQRLVTELGGVQAVREMLAGLKANADDERARLITDLTTNERCVFSADELRAMPTATLDKLAQSLRPADYSGRGGPRTHQSGDEWAVLAAPEVN